LPRSGAALWPSLAEIAAASTGTARGLRVSQRSTGFSDQPTNLLQSRPTRAKSRRNKRRWCPSKSGATSPLNKSRPHSRSTLPQQHRVTGTVFAISAKYSATRQPSWNTKPREHTAP
jgi:hypothetical protein